MSIQSAAGKILKLVGGALDGTASEAEVAKGLIDAAFDSEVAPALLMDHLTAKGIERAELAADIAEWAKLYAKQLG